MNNCSDEHEFDRATRAQYVYERGSGAKVYHGSASEKWSVGNVAHGGTTLATIVNALMQFQRSDQTQQCHLEPLQLTAHFLGRVTPGKLTIEVKRVNKTRSMTFLHAELWQLEEPSTGSFLERRKILVTVDGIMNDFPQEAPPLYNPESSMAWPVPLTPVDDCIKVGHFPLLDFRPMDRFYLDCWVDPITVDLYYRMFGKYGLWPEDTIRNSMDYWRKQKQSGNPAAEDKMVIDPASELTEYRYSAVGRSAVPLQPRHAQDSERYVPRTRHWVRFSKPRPHDYKSVVMNLDWWFSPTSTMAYFRSEYEFLSPTLSMVIDFRGNPQQMLQDVPSISRPYRDPAQQADSCPFLGVSAQVRHPSATFGAGGVGSAELDSEVWSETGRLLALARQTFIKAKVRSKL